MRQAFGDCVFDRESRELTRGGKTVHAGPKLLALLELLIDAAPRVLTKDEIHRALWPDTFIADTTLTSLVAELRAALGDRSRDPRLVRTVHGYGYAFGADVTALRTRDDRTASRCYFIVAGDREIPLSPGAHILGRGPDARIVVDDTGASRRHACITIDGSGATIEDLESKNGTTLDGVALKDRASLADGAVIVVGTTALRFRAFDATTTTATVSVPKPSDS